MVTCNFTLFFNSILVKQDDGKVIMKDCVQWNPGPDVIKKMFMLNSAEHEISNAQKYKNIKKFRPFQAQISLECYYSCS